MSKNMVRIDQILQKQLAGASVDIKTEQNGNDLFIAVRSKRGEPLIEIEDNADWISVRTDFYFVLEYSVTRFTHKDKLRKKIIKLVVDMVENGCEVQYVYRKGKLLRVVFYINGKKKASTISGLSAFGRKLIKKERFDF